MMSVDEVARSVRLEDVATWLLGPDKNGCWPSPDPSHVQTGATPPMSINNRCADAKQRWTCWATGLKGDVVDLVRYVRGIDTAAAIKVLSEEFGAGVSPRPVLARSVRPRPRKFTVSIAALNRFVHQARARLERYGDGGWCERHGVTKTQLQQFGGGVVRGSPVPGLRDPIQNGIVLPSFVRGDALAVDIRCFGTPEKYRSVRSSSYGGFGVTVGSRPGVVITEGVADAVACWANVGVTTVAVCGGFSDAHAFAVASAVKGLERTVGGPVEIMFDGDSAGRKGAERVATALIETGVVPRVVTLPAGSDLADLAVDGRLVERFNRSEVSPVRRVVQDQGVSL